MPKLRCVLATLTLAAILPTIAWTQPPGRLIPIRPLPPGMPKNARPTLEAIAETKLLMEGLTHPNFKAVDRLLKDEPADAEAWQLARGQSLLIAETANLLMIRPPKSPESEPAWMTRAIDLREKAKAMAAAANSRDLAKSRSGILEVAASCNRCHETFRVEVRVKSSIVSK